jgi:spermidine/putrescine-binding protein
MYRRDLLKTTLTAGALATPFLHIRSPRADKGELVVVSWGGDYDQAIRDFVVPAFQKNTGFTVKLDAPPETAKVKAMVQSGNINWDVILTDIPAVLTLSKDNLLEPLEYGAIDRQKLDEIPKELSGQTRSGSGSTHSTSSTIPRRCRLRSTRKTGPKCGTRRAFPVAAPSTSKAASSRNWKLR